MPPAGARAKQPVGSAAWFSAEKENISHLVDQEMEEVEYPIGHEVAWLNEHMAEVFSKNKFDFTEVFKTPGKLRGKTPRTARKRNADESRVPLSEIFSSAQKQAENKPNASPSFNRSPAKLAAPAKSSPTNPKDSTRNVSHHPYPDLSQNLNSFPEYNTDSGYHGMPADDDVVLLDEQPQSQSTEPLESQQTQVGQQHTHRSSADGRMSDSFHSAQENVRQRGGTAEPMNIHQSPKHKVEVQIPKELDKTEPERNQYKQAEPLPDSSPAQKPERGHEAAFRQPDQEEPPSRPPPTKEASAQPEDPQIGGEDHVAEGRALDNLEDIGSPSDESSPGPPLIRKSSLTFASLPAREPLTKKSSGAARVSRTSNGAVGKPSTSGSGYIGRQTGGHRTTQPALDENADDDKMDVDDPKETDEDVGSKNKLHSKSSTQRLHEKISMLGKSQPSRPTKSIPSAQVNYPELPTARNDAKPEPSSQKTREPPAPEAMEVDSEDWIKPLNSPRPPLRKSQTMDVMELDQVEPYERAENGREQDASKDEMATNDPADAGVGHVKSSSPQQAGRQRSLSGSDIPEESTTPVGSPERQDGPLSASKSKLQSIMKSAKGLFTSSGGAADAARVETSSPDEPRAARNRANTHTADVSHEQPSADRSSPAKEGRRTRSSTEREERRKQKELEDRQEAEQSKLREQEKQKAAAAKESSSVEPDARPASPKKIPRPQRQAAKEPDSADAGSKYAAPHSSSQQPSRQTDRRPVKPTREPAQKPKPQPVSIRVGSALSRQMPLAPNSLSSSVQESNPPAPPSASASKQQTIKKKPSNSSLHTASSNSSFKSSVSSQSQRKAQLASERKKEQEDREARRKEEQKRELERKRAAQQHQQQEEARRQEQRSRAEAERKERERAAVEDSKKTAQMQAIEKRRLENARRVETQGSQQPPSEPEKAGQSSRGDPGHTRSASRLGSAQPFARPISQPQPNPAKPPKRGLEDEASHRPAPRKPSATVQPSGEAKRRRTDEEQNPLGVRPTMAPPIRQSNIRKEPTKPSILGHGRPSAQAGPSAIKTAQAQRPANPMDMAKYTNGKIPFAESSNAAAPQPPKMPAANSSQKAPAKPSPKYPNGENIALPEIATDSEDEDSDAEMLPVPKWAQPKELESLLRQQEGMEVDSIFGPIAPFSLEETFKTDKKIKKFRERTSSANWSGPDALTQDEIKKDLSERQRMKLNGGWSFNG